MNTNTILSIIAHNYAANKLILSKNTYCGGHFEKYMFLLSNGNKNVLLLTLARMHQCPYNNIDILIKSMKGEQLYAPFYLACENGNYEIMRRLILDKRTNISCFNKPCNHSVIVADKWKYYDLVDILLEDERIIRSINDSQIIYHACYTHNINFIRKLLKIKEINFYSGVIMTMIDEGYIEIANLLLEDGRADPSYDNNSLLYQVCRKGNVEILEMLLKDKRIDPTTDKNLAIKEAKKHEHKDIVALLLEDERVVKSFKQRHKYKIYVGMNIK